MIRLVLCVCGLTAASVSRAQLIYSTPEWDESYGGDLGEGRTYTAFGEIFVADNTYTVMDNFKLWVVPAGGELKFAGYVAAWDGEKISGPILFASEQQTLQPNHLTPVGVTIDTGGLQLTGGSSYIAFFSVSEFFDGVEETAAFGLTVNPWTVRKSLYTFNGDLASMDSMPWTWFAWNAMFRMEFSQPAEGGGGGGGGAVPEPSTYGIIGAMALLALVGVRRLRRA